MNPRFAIVPAETAAQIDLVRELFTEYAQSLGYSLCFQGFDRELSNLPSDYAPPGGRLLLAMDRDLVAGCAAMRSLGGGYGEMKRLYVRRAYRGAGLGRELALATILEARAIGCKALRLDTLDTMTAARKLYYSIGFREIAAYYDNPIAGAEYLELPLGE